MMRAVVVLLSVLASGCARQAVPVGEEPAFSPVGAGAYAVYGEDLSDMSQAPRPSGASLWSDRAAQLFRDRRASGTGDIITVLIDVDDEAALSSSASRSRNSAAGFGINAKADVLGAAGEGSAAFNATGQTNSAGQGTVRRSEQIRLSVAAVVGAVLPNGNLAISGRQELRVNNEMRVLGVEGVVRPKDISPDNTIRYDQIAEARVAYGGAGRVAEVQQPTFLHQLYDRVAPF
jgi:flagellar L-ring protein FlgH